MSNTLEQYLGAAIDRGQIDHVLRASRSLSGKVTFYVRPLNGDGETLDFVVRGNGMALNVTNDSDVPEAVPEAAHTARVEVQLPIPKHPGHPDVPRPSDAELIELARGVCHAIEACGASPELTHAVTLASDLVAYLGKPSSLTSAPQPGEGLNFGQAIELLKTGHRVARAGWNGKGMWIAYTPGSEFAPEFAKAGHAAAHRTAEEPNEPVRLLPHIDMRAADGSMVIGWLASQTDMLADDWLLA